MTTSHTEPHGALPGDELIADPKIVFDRSRALRRPPEEIFPWLVQLGKRRAGWYLPGRLERLMIPPRRRAARTIDARWQTLAVGDRIPDYGGRDEQLEVALIDPPRTLVYRSQRGEAQFSWALVLEPAGETTLLHLRFRGRPRSTGWRLRAIVSVGDLFDWATAELMLSGLAERVESRSAPPLGAFALLKGEAAAGRRRSGSGHRSRSARR